jgi:enolase-phosphatase E1
VLRAVLYRVARHDELKLAPPFDSAEIRAILLDIEGTTTPIDFVFKTLFPFASARVEDFLRCHVRDAEIAALLEELRKSHQDHQGDVANGAPAWVDSTNEEQIASASRYVRWLIAHDSKVTSLKTLQGKIWEEGFRSGELKGEVYPDVRRAFARWKAQGRRIAIFSSGSVLAQKLLFSNSTAGDLSAFLDGYFDTTAGSKREGESYKEIAGAIGVRPTGILFVSDVGEELDAAQVTGMKTAHSLRPGIPALEDLRHREIRSFDEILTAQQ